MPFLGKKASAKVSVVRRGGAPCLFAAFATSSPPLLWQFDLEKMANHVITLREKDGEWDLGLVLPGGVFTPVAHFDERRFAEESYDAVQRALLKDAARRNHSWGKKVLTFVAVLLVLFFFAGFLPPFFAAAPQPSGYPAGGGYQNEAEGESMFLPAPPKQEIRTGVPMSADDVLTPPEE